MHKQRESFCRFHRGVMVVIMIFGMMIGIAQSIYAEKNIEKTEQVVGTVYQFKEKENYDLPNEMLQRLEKPVPVSDEGDIDERAQNNKNIEKTYARAQKLVAKVKEIMSYTLTQK